MILQSPGTVAVIGQGYVGLPLAIAANNVGWDVIGIDISEVRVENLNRGNSDLNTVDEKDLAQALNSKRYFASSNFTSVSEADVIVLCLPTPLSTANEPDLSILIEGAKAIAPHIKNGATVISESTSFPGTLRNIVIKQILAEQSNLKKEIHFAVAPERINPGDLNWGPSNTPRIVAGLTPEAQKLATNFYKTFCNFIVEADSPEEAEAAKILENSFRLLNISFINEFARVCDTAGLDTNKVVDLAATKPYGFMPFRPGIGAGGHCIPVDPIYYTTWARKLGEVAELVEVAAQINIEIPFRIAKKACSLLDSNIVEPKVLIVGLAYKSGTSDFRESPSVRIAEEISNMGIKVFWHDPLVAKWRGSNSSPLSTACDLVIYAVDQPGVNINEIISKGKPILNCTRVKFATPLEKRL